MPTRYKYIAVSSDGNRSSGVISAESAAQVEREISDRRLIPIEIKAVGKKRGFSPLGFFKGSLYDDLIMFTNNLATLYRAGIPLLRALSLIKVGPPNGRFNYAIEAIRLDVQSGKTFSESMAEFDDIFPRYFTASIAAGEESGKLDLILEESAKILEAEMELVRLIKGALRYPMMVTGAVLAAGAIMLGYVIPRFVGFYGAFGADLPLPTRILIGISNFTTTYWWVVLAVTAALVAGFFKLVSYDEGRLWVDRQLLKIPVFGQLIIKGNVARFCMMFRILFMSGLPILKALDTLVLSVKNMALAVEIKMMEQLFREGRESDLVSPDFKHFPELARQMMAIGLEAGSLEKMLDEVGRHYSREVHYTSRQLTSILEPILTLVLGVFVLTLALAIFLPMWNIIQVFKH